MDLFDFFFPEQAQAAHLRRIAARQRLPASSPAVAPHNDEIAALKTDVGFLTLVLVAILKRLAETETMSLADVRDILDEVDALDGVADHRLDPGILRGLLGVLKQEAGAENDPASEELEKLADLSRRYRTR